MHGFKTEIPLFVLKIEPNDFEEASNVQFMDSPLQGKTTLLTLDFQHQVSQALQPPIH